jgi:hypothetical protein
VEGNRDIVVEDGVGVNEAVIQDTVVVVDVTPANVLVTLLLLSSL